MIIYIMLFIIMMIFPTILKECSSHTINYNRKYNSKKIYIIFISIFLILLLFLRHDYVGSDTQNYRRNFIITNTTGIPEKIDINTEIGFIVLQLLIAKIGGDFRILLLLVAIIYIYAISKLIYKFSSIPWLSYILFMCFGFFIFNTTTRQCIALSFTIMAFINAIDKKLLKYIINTFIAITFHTSALIFIPMYWICKLKWENKTIILSIISLISVIVFKNQLAELILSIDDQANYTKVQTGGYFTILMHFGFILLGLIYKNNLLKLDINNKNFFFAMMLVIIVFPISKFNPALSRIYMYFSIYMIVYIPNVIRALYCKKLKKLVIISFILFGMFNFFYKTNTYGIRLIPYVFFWQEYPDELIPAGLLPSGKW